MFTLSPLQGALSESAASQSILELDGGIKVLVDVGWDETFDVSKLKELEKYVIVAITVIFLYIVGVRHQDQPACMEHGAWPFFAFAFASSVPVPSVVRVLVRSFPL